ncbi:MAG: cyclopropane-fatty-acyl-phospholipid synthase [Legionellaceae bacterium]|nr:cyclopropane-fatty-acyl-phospholipid synthase [Legionellaceae bacterium]
MENNITVKSRSNLSKNIFLKLLSKIVIGKITVYDSLGEYQFGGMTSDDSSAVTVTINTDRAYRSILLGGSLGAANSYINGEWDSNDLQKLIEIFIHNEQLFNKIESPFAKLSGIFKSLQYKFSHNSIRRAKNNILAHYDLGNEFFELFLDPTMMYSAALFEPNDIDLEQASRKKLHAICEGLELKSSDSLMEIGTGWGGLAIYAAQNYGCKVTTTTISEKQYNFTKAKIQQLGLEKKINLIKQDYRKISGQFDKLVSIEMIEAVGHKYFSTFFKKCDTLLKPGGLMFLQAIVINDQEYERAKNEVDFIKKYIFPGGCIPSIQAIANSVGNNTNLQLTSLRDIGKHYVTTLNAWEKRLFANAEQAKAQGFTTEFLRMWQFYFCYCAAGFQTNYISDIHAIWRKRK